MPGALISLQIALCPREDKTNHSGQGRKARKTAGRKLRLEVSIRVNKKRCLGL